MNENNDDNKYRYSLLKIDVTDTVPFADFFDDDHYVGFENSDNLEQILDLAVINFWKLNPGMKSYKDWETKAEDGGTDFQIVAGNKTIFRASMLLVDPRLMGAIYLIREYHKGQTRKGDGYPFLEHPLEVGFKLWRDGFPGDVVTAGLCHDLLEDTDCPESEIEEKCGAEVLRIVKAVSNDETLSDKKDWELKKEKYVKSVEYGGEKAIAVSVMDKICNLHSFFDQYEKDGPGLWKKYNWNHPLLKQLEDLVIKLEKTSE